MLFNALPEFQFHKGTIRTQNIIKMGYDNQLFQFHKGTIRTFCSKLTTVPFKFQFHKGTIRTFCSFSGIILRLFHFNSIKVQLERWLLQNSLQSSYYFNSIKVQLEPSDSFLLYILGH